jgi:GTP-binding protein EngB required for normal cell division
MVAVENPVYNKPCCWQTAYNLFRCRFDMIVKVLAIGDSAVGKTCLVNRFVRNEFTLRTIHTIGVDFAVQTVRVSTPAGLQLVHAWQPPSIATFVVA